MMRYLNRCPLILATARNLLAIFQHKAHISSNSKLEKANAILKGYIKSNSTNKALFFFRNLLRRDASSIDSFSLLFVLKACTIRSCAVESKQMHALILKLGYRYMIFLQTTLMNTYSGMGHIDDAHKVFDEMRKRNVVCWTAIISAYVDNGKPNKALKLFRKMQMENVDPDSVTVTVALSACADLGALEMGDWIHSCIGNKRGIRADLHLKNALINMYAKCGDIGTARRMFDNLSRRDVTTWTSMIVGHALHGQAKEALQLFDEMREQKKKKMLSYNGSGHIHGLVVPNLVTFIGVLMACSHAGLVEEGWRHLESMSKDYGLKPRISHYGCMVDLLCRGGHLKEAYAFIMDMPIEPNAVVWRTLLSACSLQGNIDLGANVRCRLLKLEPHHLSDDVAMSNTYAAVGMWNEKEGVRAQIKQRRVPGCSSIELGIWVHEFSAGDSRRELHEILEGMAKIMNYEYASDISSLVDNCNLQD